MSFADPKKAPGTQFLGCLVLKAEDIIDAAQKAHRLKLNPGGEILASKMPTPMSPKMFEVLEPYLGKLLSAELSRELDAKLGMLVN